MPNRQETYLGLDDSCSYCRNIAGALARALGDAVVTVPLTDERMQRWRKEVWGDNAPWAPTLIRVGDGSPVQGWTGWRIAPALTRAVGPQRAMAALSALGAEELGRSSNRPGRQAQPRKITRRTSLQAGLALTAGVLLFNGGGLFGRGSSAAAAPSRRALSESRLTGESADEAVRKMWESIDVRNVVNEAEASGLVAAGDFAGLLGSPRFGVATALAPTVETTVLRTDLEVGIERLLVVEYDETNERLLCYAVYSEPIDGVLSSAFAVQFSGWDAENARPERFRVLASSFNGEVPTPVPEAKMAAALRDGKDPCGGCNGVCQVGGQQLRGECRTGNVVSCVLGAAGCALCATCSGTGVCIACFIVSCGGALLSCCEGIHNEACRRCVRVC